MTAKTTKKKTRPKETDSGAQDKAIKAPTKTSAAQKAPKSKTSPKAAGGASAMAEQILESESPGPQVAAYGQALGDDRATVATQAARILAEVGAKKPELLVPLTEKLARALSSDNRRVVQTASDALPALGRIAPARVARHLETLKGAFDKGTETARDGMVRTFAALCVASVAYQKRLEPILAKALSQADGKTLLRWTEIILPSLKGEPHARARAVVERRLYEVARPLAQKVADYLGIKLRPQGR